MKQISILPEQWRVYIDDVVEKVGNKTRTVTKVFELEEGAESPPDGGTVFVLVPPPLDMSLTALQGVSIAKGAEAVHKRAHEVITGFEGAGVTHPRTGDALPWSPEIVAALPRQISGLLIGWAQDRTWGGDDTEGNEPSESGPETRSSDGTDTTDPAAAESTTSS